MVKEVWKNSDTQRRSAPGVDTRARTREKKQGGRDGETIHMEERVSNKRAMMKRARKTQKREVKEIEHNGVKSAESY